MKNNTIKFLSEEQIEEDVNSILKDIWNEAGCPESTSELLRIFHPKNFINHQGYTYIERENLGEVRFNRQKFETAGLVDHQSETVAISLMFKSYEQKFTAGHEAGHILYHKDLTGNQHRDRPIGSEVSKDNYDPMEWQANKVSTYINMPKFLLLREVKRRFGKELPLYFNDQISFLLNPSNPNLLMSSKPKNLDREIAMATYTDGGKIVSLVELFDVSVEAMAIRLQELGVVRYP